MLFSFEPGEAAKFGGGPEFARKAVDEKAEPLLRPASAGSDKPQEGFATKRGHSWLPGVAWKTVSSCWRTAYAFLKDRK
jgi:hypothetical protein